MITLVGCISPNMEKLYVADLGVNQTYNVNFRIGFYGKPDQKTRHHFVSR